MRIAIVFILSFYVVSVFLMFVANAFFQFANREAASYSIWLYIFSAVISVTFLPFVVDFIAKRDWDLSLKRFILFLLLLVVLNLVLNLAGFKGIATFSLMKSRAYEDDSMAKFNLFLHLSFVLSYVINLLIFRKRLFLNQHVS